MVFYIYLYFGLTIFLLILHSYLLSIKGESVFSLPIFLITFFAVFLLRFFRFPLRHFYFFTFCPVAAAFSSYISPISGSLASFFGVFLFGLFILKDRFLNIVHTSLSYLSGALFLSLIRYIELPTERVNILIFLVVSPLLYPIFFYLPIFIRKKVNLKIHLYTLAKEVGLIFFYMVFIFLFYDLIKNKNFWGIIFLLPLIFMSILVLRDYLNLDKLSILYRTEALVTQDFSMEKFFSNMFNLLKEYIDFDHMKIFVKEDGKIKCAYADEKEYLEKTFSTGILDMVGVNEKVYIKKIEKKYEFFSPNTLSVFLISFYKDKKLSGLLSFESKIEDNFSEDDRERFIMVSNLVARIILIYLYIQELPHLSEDIVSKTKTVCEILNKFTSHVTKFNFSLSQTEGSFSDISEKIRKNFDILELIAQEFEKAKDEISFFASFFRGKRPQIQTILFSLKNVEESMDRLKGEFRKLKENILSSISLIEKIHGFVEFMKDYASKTRLLSLNASIEATRLGEEARGFSIIAGEIGSLAQSVENVISRLTQEFVSFSEILENTRSYIGEYESLLEKSFERFLESEKREREVLTNTVELLPKIENMPLFFESSVTKLSEVIRLIGEELQEAESGTQRMKELIEDLKEINSYIKKIESGINECRVISDKIKMIEEEIRGGRG
ncbi:MAG: methyl-accepting chemotaxis protein [Candidatus Hydrothermales bacterium]